MNGERETGNGKRAAGNGERETGNGERETGNGKQQPQTTSDQFHLSFVICQDTRHFFIGVNGFILHTYGDVSRRGPGRGGK